MRGGVSAGRSVVRSFDALRARGRRDSASQEPARYAASDRLSVCLGRAFLAPWLPWSRAFASRFSSLPRARFDLRLVLSRDGRLAPFPSPLHSLVTLGQEADKPDEPPWRRPDDSSPVIRGPRSRSPFDSDRASAFAPAPALDHAATAFAFAFAFAFATPTKPPPPRYANDRRAKGDCPSERRSGAQSSLAPRSVELFSLRVLSTLVSTFARAASRLSTNVRDSHTLRASSSSSPFCRFAFPTATSSRALRDRRFRRRDDRCAPVKRIGVRVSLPRATGTERHR